MSTPSIDERAIATARQPFQFRKASWVMVISLAFVSLRVSCVGRESRDRIGTVLKEEAVEGAQWRFTKKKVYVISMLLRSLAICMYQHTSTGTCW